MDGGAERLAKPVLQTRVPSWNVVSVTSDMETFRDLLLSSFQPTKNKRSFQKGVQSPDRWKLLSQTVNAKSLCLAHSQAQILCLQASFLEPWLDDSQT